MEFYKIKNQNNNSYSYGGQTVISETIKLADPNYDLTFRNLFSPSKRGETIWKDRAISLLKSLIIEGQIKDIDALKNENIQKDINKTNIGVYSSLLRSSLALELEMKDEEVYEVYNIIGLLNIEMQWGYPYNFLETLVNYGLSLKNKYKRIKKYIQVDKDKTFVLAFINCIDNVKLKSKSYFLAEFSSENNKFIKKVDDFLDIIIINLQEISQKLENDEKIYILGKEIGPTGKNWLKLLSLNHWGIEADKNYFKIPNFNFNEEISSAINYLKGVENNYKKAETGYLDKLIKTQKEKEAEEEYWDSVMAAAEEKAKEIVERKIKMYPKLKEFIRLYKILPLVNLEKLAEEPEFINFSEIDMYDVMKFWGDKDDNKEKLEYLKDFIGKKKRSINDE